MNKVTISPAKIRTWFNNSIVVPKQNMRSSDEGSRAITLDFSQEKIAILADATVLQVYERTDEGLANLLTQLKCMGFEIPEMEFFLADVIDEPKLNTQAVEDIIDAKNGESTGPAVDAEEPALETPVIETPKSNWKDKLPKVSKVGQYIGAGLVLVAGAVAVYKLFEKGGDIIDAASTVGDVIDGVAEAGEVVTTLLD